MPEQADRVVENKHHSSTQGKCRDNIWLKPSVRLRKDPYSGSSFIRTREYDQNKTSLLS